MEGWKSCQRFQLPPNAEKTELGVESHLVKPGIHLRIFTEISEEPGLKSGDFFFFLVENGQV